MSIIASWKKCPKCGKMYSYNPDVGKFRCPKCMGTGMKLKKHSGITAKDKQDTDSQYADEDMTCKFTNSDQ